MSFAELTPVSALGGGVLIGLGASLFLVVNGRIAGISGLLAGLVSPSRGDVGFRVLFLLGLVVGGGVTVVVAPEAIGKAPAGVLALALAGLLVGFGTRTSGGCTSGHGVCGIGRGSLPSLLATVIFVTTGAVTATLVRLLGGFG